MADISWTNYFENMVYLLAPLSQVEQSKKIQKINLYNTDIHMIYNIFIYDCKLPDHCYVAVMEFCKFYEVQNFEKTASDGNG